MGPGEGILAVLSQERFAGKGRGKIVFFTSDDKVSAGVDVVLGVFGDVLLGDGGQNNLGVKVQWC